MKNWFFDNIISILALLISCLAYLASRRADKRSLEIEESKERDRLLEKKKARLIPQIIREAPNQTKLFIENRGDSEAKDIQIIIDGQPFSEHEMNPSIGKEIKQLGGNSHIQYPIAISFGMGLSWEIELTWNDDSGEPGYYKTTVTL